ncbi:hypothetical protein ACD591_20780 [Rufibacter glacialis]|uniref:Lipoprotein n=1 Tax=Rufibacter glacialis TaxID=1259555 RepID=A0A5M8QHA2_9BACT|nr:hypothetical protein [Rufibacter glacialis]KAA6434213.1 hypothetical protein FOE74_08370 [Rufibacter glacialis]GGK67802.1 hypothetical protein GCM10011405_14710 [Rufibacter glacialis]
MRKLLLSLVLLTSLLSSCGDDEITRDPDKMGLAYFPLQVGKYWVFDVTETKYVNNITSKTNFQIREEIDEVTKDQLGKEWFRMKVSKRNSPTSAWNIIGVKMVAATNTDLQVKDNNRTTVELVFPMAEGKKWNPNAFNSAYGKDEEAQNQSHYFYKGIDQPFDMEGKVFPFTVTVVKAEGTPKDISFTDVVEVYSKDQGPVYRAAKNRYYCDAGPGTNCEIGSGYIISGLDRVEKLLEAGKAN